MIPNRSLLVFALVLACDATTDDGKIPAAEIETAAPTTKTAEAPSKAPVAPPKVETPPTPPPEAKIEAKVETKAATPIPATRPKTLTQARDHLIAIGKQNELGELAKLADAKHRLEHTHQHERGRKKRTYLDIDDPAKLAESFQEKDDAWKPVQYIGAIAQAGFDGSLENQLTLDEAKHSIRFEPEGMFDITFRFVEDGDELVLVGIDTHDEEP